MVSCLCFSYCNTAVRGKKHSHSTTVAASLKANKKVSSMVNKWLAAKEELHSSEEDEEDKALFDLEAIEKKRQKEIEVRIRFFLVGLSLMALLSDKSEGLYKN
jgi:hypothetical protein